MDPVAAARAARNPVPEPPAVARTYRGDRDGWDRVLEHWRVQRYSAKHPDDGSGAIASELDLPRGRIRTWIDDGGAPDPVRGLQTAFDRDWIVDDLDLRRRRALAVAIAWIFAGGSISTDWFTPRFTAQSDAERERITDAVWDLGVELTWTNRDDQGKGLEAEPASDASVFGRVLVAAGAPLGPSDVFPHWIRDAPKAVQRDAAAAYVECRGQLAGNAGLLQIREEGRPDAHLEAIGELLVTVAAAGSYTISGANLRLDREGTDVLLAMLDVEI